MPAKNNSWHFLFLNHHSLPTLLLISCRAFLFLIEGIFGVYFNLLLSGNGRPHLGDQKSFNKPV